MLYYQLHLCAFTVGKSQQYAKYQLTASLVQEDDNERVALQVSRGISSSSQFGDASYNSQDDYSYTASDDRPSTGKFSMARPMGYIDMCINRGKREPGPFDYPQPGLGDAGQRPGGKFSAV